MIQSWYNCSLTHIITHIPHNSMGKILQVPQLEQQLNCPPLELSSRYKFRVQLQSLNSQPLRGITCQSIGAVYLQTPTIKSCFPSEPGITLYPYLSLHLHLYFYLCVSISIFLLKDPFLVSSLTSWEFRVGIQIFFLSCNHFSVFIRFLGYSV